MLDPEPTAVVEEGDGAMAVLPTPPKPPPTAPPSGMTVDARVEDDVMNADVELRLDKDVVLWVDVVDVWKLRDKCDIVDADSELDVRLVESSEVRLVVLDSVVEVVRGAEKISGVSISEHAGLQETLTLPLVTTRLCEFDGWVSWEEGVSTRLDCELSVDEDGKKDPVMLALSELAGLGGRGDEGEGEITCCELRPCRLMDMEVEPVGAVLGTLVGADSGDCVACEGDVDD